MLELKRNEYLYDTYFVLVGNKVDCEDTRAVTEIDGKEYANSQDVGFAEVSAKTGRGINELFD